MKWILIRFFSLLVVVNFFYICSAKYADYFRWTYPDFILVHSNKKIFFHFYDLYFLMIKKICHTQKYNNNLWIQIDTVYGNFPHVCLIRVTICTFFHQFHIRYIQTIKTGETKKQRLKKMWISTFFSAAGPIIIKSQAKMKK